MRVVQVFHGWPPEAMGGTGLYVQALADGLREAGCHVWLAHPGAPGPAGVSEAGEQVTLTGPAPQRWAESWRRQPALSAWQRWLRGADADVVHVHHLSGMPLGLLRACRQLGVRTVLTLHDYALPCARGQLIDRDGARCPGPEAHRCAGCLAEQLRLDPLTASIAAFLQRWPGLRHQARSAVSTLSIRPRDAARVQARLDAVRAAFSDADVLLSPSHDLAARISQLGLRRPSWCPLPLIQPIPPAPPPGDGPVRFLFASSVIPTKGPHVLLDAFQALPPGRATLTIAGHAPPFDGWPRYAEDLQSRAAGVPGVRWAGGLPPSAVPGLLAAHDVLVLPSLWPENSPLIVREATAAGLPVIASAEGGARELAPDAALIVPGDTAGLTAALRSAVARGRQRQAPRRWQDRVEHAAWMMARYRSG